MSCPEPAFANPSSPRAQPGRRLHILVVTGSYAPEPTGIAPLNTELCEYLVSRGHQVSVVTGVPHYPEWKIPGAYRGKLWQRETQNGVVIYRGYIFLPAKRTTVRRILYDTSIGVSAGLRGLLIRRVDLVLAVSPPLQAGLAGSFLSRLKGTPLLLHIKDLVPDLAIALGMLRNRWAIKLARSLENYVYRQADRILVLGEGFRANLLAKGVPEPKLCIVPDWVDVRFIHPGIPPDGFRKTLLLGGADFMVLHIGNLGAKQKLDNVIRAADQLRAEQNIRFFFVGDGTDKQRLQEYARKKALLNVRFLPLQPREKLPELLSSANVLLLNQSASVMDMVIPSKLLTYMAAGRAVVAAVAAQSEAAECILRAGCGVVVPPEDPAALAQAIRALYSDRDVAARLGQRGRIFAEQHFAREPVLDCLESHLFSLSEKKQETRSSNGRQVTPKDDRAAGLRPDPMRAMQILAVGLLACLAGAVLAFGGTEPLPLAAAELLAFLLFGFVLWIRKPGKLDASLPWKGSALLLGYVGLETAIVQPAGYLARGQIFQFIACVCIFYVAVVVSRSENSRRYLLHGLLGLGLFEALYGLVQYVSGWQQIFAYKKVFYVAQATGTYINPNHFAGLLEMILPLSFALALGRLERLGGTPQAGPSGAKRTPTSESIATLVFFLFSTLLLYAAIFFSGSRAGLLCASAALAALAAAWMKIGWRQTRVALATACVLAGTFLFGLWIGLGPVASRFEKLGRDHQSRLDAWKDTLELIRMHPVLGWGPGTFLDAYPQVQSTFLTQTVDHAHNDYLEFAAEWGVLGAALLFGVIFWVLVRALSFCLRLRCPTERLVYLGSCAGILALLLHSMVDFNLHIPANALGFAALLGVAYSGVCRVSPSSVLGGKA